VEELLNENRYKLYAKRGVLQAHLEMIEIAIHQHNRHFEETANLREHGFKQSDEETFKRFLNEIEDC
jgi:hypothetical protein